MNPNEKLAQTREDVGNGISKSAAALLEDIAEAYVVGIVVAASDATNGISSRDCSMNQIEFKNIPGLSADFSMSGKVFEEVEKVNRGGMPQFGFVAKAKDLCANGELIIGIAILAHEATTVLTVDSAVKMVGDILAKTNGGYKVSEYWGNPIVNREDLPA